MMNAYDYNGFDALDSQEYNELMEELADDNARECFEKEIEKDAIGFEMQRPRYQVIITWGTACKTESTANITQALGAAEIFIEDPDCDRVVIYDWKALRDVFNWSRD